jgi:hypothetical protein
MSTDHKKAALNLEAVLLNESDVSPDQLRKQLSDEGVDVTKFLSRLDTSYRKGLQADAKKKASLAKARAQASRGSLFGDLLGKPRAELIAFVQAALKGQYGAEAMARCRNKTPEQMSDDEIRSWLEDIEHLNSAPE